MGIKTRKIVAGEYEVSDGERSVTLSKVEFWDGPAWIAAAQWSTRLYTDPLPTKRDAKRNAIEMLSE